MTVLDVQRAFVRRFGIRIGARTAQYVLDHMGANATEKLGNLPVMGGDARTGIPLRVEVPLNLLNAHSLSPVLRG